MHKLEEFFNIKFNDITLLETALTHSTYAYEHNKVSNQRLEFLGDAIVDLLVGEYLYKTCSDDEGVLTKRRANIVCEKSLAYFASLCNLEDYLLLGKGEEKQHGRDKDSVRADAFESFLAAVYLDQGLESCRKIINKIVIPNLEYAYNETIDYKSMLQEFLQADKRNLRYEQVSESGKQHDKTFTVKVIIDDIVFGTGSGKSHLDAERNAAKMALSKMAVIKND